MSDEKEEEEADEERRDRETGGAAIDWCEPRSEREEHRHTDGLEQMKRHFQASLSIVQRSASCERSM